MRRHWHITTCPKRSGSYSIHLVSVLSLSTCIQYWEANRAKDELEDALENEVRVESMRIQIIIESIMSKESS